MDKKVYCPFQLMSNWFLAKVKFLVDMMLFLKVSDLEGCAFSIFDLSLTQLAWVALTYNFVWPCQPTCKLIEWSSITCSQEKEREIKMKPSVSAIWWQIEKHGGGQVRLAILLAYVLRKWKSKISLKIERLNWEIMINIWTMHPGQVFMQIKVVRRNVKMKCGYNVKISTRYFC